MHRAFREARPAAEIDRPQAETATVEAQLSARCAQRVDQSGVCAGVLPLAALSRQIGAAFDLAASPAHRRKQADVEGPRRSEVLQREQLAQRSIVQMLRTASPQTQRR